MALRIEKPIVSISRVLLFKFRTLKQLKGLLVRLCRVTDGSAGQKKFFKVKYLSGALLYGAKIQSDAYIKNYIDLRTLQFLAPFLGFEKLFPVLLSYL
jgi:hypothetical protein